MGGFVTPTLLWREFPFPTDLKVVGTLRGYSVHFSIRDTDMDISLENETQYIYRKEIEALIQREEKYRDLSPADLEAIVRAFELTLTNGREKVRAQMLYDLIHQKRDD